MHAYFYKIKLLKKEEIAYIKIKEKINIIINS